MYDDDSLDELPIELPPCDGLRLDERTPCARLADYRVPCAPVDDSGADAVVTKGLCGVHRQVAINKGRIRLQGGGLWERVWPPRSRF